MKITEEITQKTLEDYDLLIQRLQDEVVKLKELNGARKDLISNLTIQLITDDPQTFEDDAKWDSMYAKETELRTKIAELEKEIE